MDLAPTLYSWAMAAENARGARKEILPAEKYDKPFLAALRLGELFTESQAEDESIIREQLEAFLQVLIPELELSHDLTAYDSKLSAK